MSKAALLETINNDYKNDIGFKHLSPSNFVPGVGNADSHTILIGEAPGKNEDTERVPFVGVSGMVLSGIFDLVGLERDEFYITNVLKFRPPDNRDPLEHEIVRSIPYLRKEISIVQPNNIVLLGKIPCRAFFPGTNFFDLRGKVKHLGKYRIFITHHPAASVHTTNDKKKELIKKEITNIFRTIKEDLTE